MTDDVFLSAILAEPDDDLPRLAYADWLEERGDPRGEFIHIQCRLACLEESDPHHPRLKERERELLDRHEADWLGELRPLTRQCLFRRGFLDEVALVPAAFLAYRPPPCPPTVRRVLVSLEDYQVDQQLIEYMPESVARENVCFLFAERDRALFVATEERPEDPQLIEKLTFILNRDIVPVPAPREQIVEAIVRHYGNTETESVECVLYEAPADYSPNAPDVQERVALLVILILREAVRQGATRVRLEPFEHDFEAYYRILGQDVQRDVIPRSLVPAVVRHIRELCRLSEEDGQVQQGSFEMRMNHLLSLFDVRIIPTPDGPRVVLDVDTTDDLGLAVFPS